MMNIKRTDSSNTDFQGLVKLLDADLAIRNGDEHSFYDQFNKIDSIKHCIVIYIDGMPAACGAFKQFSEDAVEIKRMYTHPDFRKKGLATAIVQELESWQKNQDIQKQFWKVHWSRTKRCPFMRKPAIAEFLTTDSILVLIKASVMRKK